MPIAKLTFPEGTNLSHNLRKLYDEIEEALTTSKNCLNVSLTLPPKNPEDPRGAFNIAIEINGWTRTFDPVYEKDELLKELTRTFA